MTSNTETALAREINRRDKPNSAFARAAAAAAFGRKYWGWREWDTFNDRAPGDEPAMVWGARR